MESPNLEDLIPTTITLQNNELHCEGISPISLSTAIHNNNNTYLEWLHCTVEQSDSITSLLEDIRNGSSRCVSDGSYNPHTQIGTASWIIESHNQLEYIRGTSIVPGHHSIQSAYRSELVGLLALLEQLHNFTIDYSIMDGETTIACDGVNALDKVKYKGIDKLSPNTKHSDIVSAIKQRRQTLAIDIITRHVKGHQDDLMDFDELDRYAQLNVMMDIDAKSLSKELAQSDDPHIFQRSLHHILHHSIYPQFTTT